MRRRIAAAAVLAVGLALGTAGCTFFAPQATLLAYNPSDGVSLNVGKLQVRNAFAISPKGTDANLVGVFINTSKSDVVVELQYTAHVNGKSKVTNELLPLTAGDVVSLGNPGVPQIVFRNADVKPGALLKIFVVYGDTASGVTVSGKNLQIPVLNGSQEAYKHLGPTPTPKPTPTGTPLPTMSPTPGN
ncbi:MAG: hypothetical protein WDM88_02985 [Galbitalea sp.]